MTIKEHLLSNAIKEWDYFGNQEITGYEKRTDGSYKRSNSGNFIPIFRKFGHREEESPYYKRVKMYWNSLNPDSNRDGRSNVPWSAAFISYLMKISTLKKIDFFFNEQHSQYIRKAILSKQNNDTSYGFWGYRLNEYQPEVGDLVCYVREDAVGTINYDSVTNDYPSHSDLVVEKIGNTLKVIGGNIEDSVTMKHLEIDNNGYLTDKSKSWFVILKNRLKESVIVEDTTNVQVKKYVVTGDGVRLRSYPTKEENNIIDSLFKGDEVDYIQLSEDRLWSKVTYQDKTGWMSNLYLKPIITETLGNNIDSLLDIVSKSTIINYSWNNRGKAPLAYYQGMALMFARLYCRLKNGDEIAKEISKPAGDNPKKDSLAYYNDEFESLGMDNDSAGSDTLRHCFVMMFGLGMRESSGRHCVGRDTTAENTDAETAEAGLFQTSYNARSLSPLLPVIFNNYKANPDGFIDIFSKGIKPCGNNNWENFGEGNGKDFQKLSKECPGFAVEFTAVAMRNTSRHWGPIINKKVEIKSECEVMLLKVQNYIDQNHIQSV